MSIEIKQVNVLDNPACFKAPFKFEITFDCLAPGVKDELEWKLVYVGSADNDDCDQELDSVLVGPVQVGKNRFIFQAPCPDASKIPERDLLDVTVLLLTCSYNTHEFIRVGYYVSNEYPGFNADSGMPMPSPIDINKIKRNILANKPRVTRFHVNWDNDQNNNTTNNNNNNNNSNDNNCNNNNNNQNGNNNQNNDDTDEKSQSNVASGATGGGIGGGGSNMFDNSMDNFIVDDTNGNVNGNNGEKGGQEDDDDDDDMIMAD